MNTDPKKKSVIPDKLSASVNLQLDDSQVKKIGPNTPGKPGGSLAGSNSKIEADDNTHAGSQKRAYKPATKTGLLDEGSASSQRTDCRKRSQEERAQETREARTHVRFG